MCQNDVLLTESESELNFKREIYCSVALPLLFAVNEPINFFVKTVVIFVFTGKESH